MLKEKLREFLGIDKVLRGQEKLKEKIPEKVLEEFKEVREITSKPVARRILKIVEGNNGEINVTKLRNECETNSICSRNTFYKYIKKLEHKGVIERVKEGKRVYIRSSSKTVLNISQ
ncbi:hypothetical protein AKJ51_04715 [candidate division MSBL1 archaeon SCGC-AAA382A20]|uniref:Uncharacterized protein n=1 Tax=candidate division MSBL1 archaeon SCGC-AAA382A20 TaxID=1698280 RepID=A0A133VHC3_9EURY|nr:hypothetical protein AKJ51_04715 [candidate division MSBL1 archaeon SCGC-AAA382A20]